MSEMPKSNRPFAISLIAAINGIAALLHLSFWVLAFIKLPPFGSPSTIAERISLATTYGFGIADLIWSFPFLFLGSILLLKNYLLGWLCAHFANVLYWYSFTVIVTRDSAAGSLSPGTILFLPFAVFAFWAAYSLWKNRYHFME
ncbi:MAG: hypothetical protein DWQ10_02330 [Calditrichaeota bacterium]|nr:MAG: hypothetical protein DWQ10_02330 [Calditrichota bacterium]